MGTEQKRKDGILTKPLLGVAFERNPVLTMAKCQFSRTGRPYSARLVVIGTFAETVNPGPVSGLPRIREEFPSRSRDFWGTTNISRLQGAQHPRARSINDQLWTLMIALGFNAVVSVRVSNEISSCFTAQICFALLSMQVRRIDVGPGYQCSSSIATVSLIGFIAIPIRRMKCSFKLEDNLLFHR
uniref:Uncharacterized protein n=1 Tax=Oryza sativa subsp. japonica TaxID=39947 RepID=Q2R4H8_ORYSJ|nr:hypothetical protein LOC_Os11g28430 [Oryza sativa Japonica Group]